MKRIIVAICFIMGICGHVYGAETVCSDEKSQAVAEFNTNPNPVENLKLEEIGYISGGGGISDGKYIWIIPYEPNSFARLNMETGQKEDLTEHESYDALCRLEGYLTGALHEDDNGGRFIYLAPFLPTKPLVKINTDTLEIEYPVRSVGYYYGSSLVIKEGGKDYLWLFPGKVKPEAADKATEITIIDLTENVKTATIPSKIDGEYQIFSEALEVDRHIWLFPAEYQKPLVRLYKDTFEFDTIQMDYQRASGGIFDGENLWFTVEDVSYSINDSLLIKASKNGSILEKYKLTKNRYVKALDGGRWLYLFSSAEGELPVNIVFNKETGSMELIPSAENKNYLPSCVTKFNDDIWILPETKNRRKMPVVRIMSDYKEIKSFSIIKNESNEYILTAEIATDIDDKNIVGICTIDAENLYAILKIVKNEREALEEKTDLEAGEYKANLYNEPLENKYREGYLGYNPNGVGVLLNPAKTDETADFVDANVEIVENETNESGANNN